MYLICNNKDLTEDDLGSVLDEKEKNIEPEKQTQAEEIAEDAVTAGESPAELQVQVAETPVTKIATLKEIEMEAIKSSVERNKWNMTTTAEELGISRMTLYRKLEQYGLRSKDQ